MRDELTRLSSAVLDAAARLREAVSGIVSLGVHHRPTYELMFTVPLEHADVVANAAAQAQDVFIALVAAVVGEETSQRKAALLMAGAHGIAGMAANGHLRVEKWGVDASELIDTLVSVSTMHELP